MAKRQTSPATPRRRRTDSVSDSDQPTPVLVEAEDRGEAAMSSEEIGADPSHDEIAARAYELWVQRGCTYGGEFDDWLRAERELRGRSGR